MNIRIESAINARQTQYYISPVDNSPPLNPTESEMIVKHIILGKPSESIGDNLNPGKHY